MPTSSSQLIGLSYHEETLPLEGTETYICPTCDEPLIATSHRKACDIVAKIKRWKVEGTLLQHCTVGPPPLNPYH